MFSRGIRADAGARARARKNTAKYAAELRLYTRSRMSNLVPRPRSACVSVLSRTRAAVY